MEISKLKGEQTKVLYLAPNKHNVVLGVAGSGKTLIAILRAKYLANLAKEKNERVLLTTYNTTLDRYFYLLEDEIPENLDICVYHKYARGYLKTVGKMNNNCILDNKKYLVEQALNKIKSKYHELKISTLERPPEIFAEEITWIEKMGIENLLQYIDAERIGRGKTRIKREDRKYFFEVYEKYLELREENGFLYDWDDIARTVRDELINDKNPRYYKHIIIDEGQDFSPIMIQSLVNSIPEDGSLTFFGDVAQQIYGNRYSWRDAGIKIGSSGIYKFQQNYRNSKEIWNFANDITKMSYWKKDEDILEPMEVKAEGPRPVLVRFPNFDGELDYISFYLEMKETTDEVAILVRNNEKVYRVLEILTQKGIKCQKIDKSMQKNTKSDIISVGTYHSSKGLEYDTVILPFLNKDELPPKDTIEIHEEDYMMPNELKLLYVAVTRAKRGLFMSYSEEELTKIFPIDSENYNKEVINI